MRKHDKKYIEFTKNKIHDVLNDNREFSDWTQISLSAKDAVKALADVIGTSDDDSICTINAFLSELTYKMIEDVRDFDITFKKKENGDETDSI